MPDPTDRSLFEEHPREFEKNLYAYPVLSRRAGGISIGVNLNLDAFCNFDCIYCQVVRSGQNVGHAKSSRSIDIARLESELDWMVDWAVSGRIWQGTKFAKTPKPLRRLNDVAFSGDGEPTACPDFDKAVAVAADIRRRRRLDGLKLILITNSSLLDREHVRRGLTLMDSPDDEIWAKLDAGSDEYYQKVDRSKVPFSRILSNLLAAAKDRPIVIQSLFMRINGQPAGETELLEYCRRLQDILSGGGKIKLVQIHTVARAPAESWVSALDDEPLDAIAELVRRETGLPISVSYA